MPVWDLCWPPTALFWENGELALQGKTSDLMLDENVKKAYLGV